jgi:hypothetical protein
MRRARRAALAFAIAVAIFSIYGLEYLFARVIVGSMKPFNAAQITPNKRTAIVLLGSGSWHAMDWDGRIAVYPDPAAASRELEAVRVFRLVNPAVVDLVGWESASAPAGGPRRRGDARTSGGAGRPADRILVETESGTTRDEALIVDRMLKAQGSSRSFWLPAKLTCAARLASFDRLASKRRQRLREFLRGQATWSDLLLPSQGGLDLGSQNLHEILGLGYYWLRGWHR